MQTDDVVIRVQPLGETWETLGVDRMAGVYAESDSLTLSANSWGSDKASFDLHRDPVSAWPDLTAWTPIEIEIGGVLVWSGRISETPTTEGDDLVINVQAEGWQYHLDDDLYSKLYVHAALTDWIDWRAAPNAPLGSSALSANAQVQSDQGALLIEYPGGTTTAAFMTGAVLFDAGPFDTIARVVWNYQTSANNNGSPQVQIFGRGIDSPTNAGAVAFWSGFALTTVGAGPTTTSATLATPKRYIAFGLVWNGAGSATNDAWLRLNSVILFSNTAWESGGVSILKATDVITDALTHAPLLSSDRSGVAATSFNIPEFVVPVTSPMTPREVWQAANAFHNYIAKIDPERRPIFQPRPSTPKYEMGAWSPSDFKNASANSTDDIFNAVLVAGTAPDGSPVSVLRTAPITTLADRRGFTKKAALQISSTLTPTVAQQIGDVWLAAHSTTPFKGSVSVHGFGAVRDTAGGHSVHPSQLLRETGELLRMADRYDPDTGGWGRDGLIANVTYTHADRTAQIDLDSGRENVEAFLARLAVVTGAALGQ